MSKNPYILKNGKEHQKFTKTGIWKVRTKHRYDIGLLNSLVLFFKNTNFTVYDFGCGDASYSKALIEKEIDVKCYDGNPNTVTITDGLGEILDLVSDFKLPIRDWVICFEVGEHIPKEYESKFIENLCKHATKGIILSWSITNQGGSGHVNCQDNEYVKSCLRKHGFIDNKKLENIFRENITKKNRYFRKTIMIFEKQTTEKFSPLRLVEEFKKVQDLPNFIFYHVGLSLRNLEIKETECWKGLRCRQYPEELASLLEFAKTNNITSYLELGCNTGGTLLALDSYLRSNGVNIQSLGIDKRYKPLKVYENYNKKYPNCKIIQQDALIFIPKHNYDLGFIDIDHSYETTKKAFDILKNSCRFIAFHNIYCKSYPGVGKFWNEIKVFYFSLEILNTDNRFPKPLGIGVLKMPANKI